MHHRGVPHLGALLQLLLLAGCRVPTLLRSGAARQLRVLPCHAVHVPAGTAALGAQFPQRHPAVHATRQQLPGLVGPAERDRRRHGVVRARHAAHRAQRRLFQLLPLRLLLLRLFLLLLARKLLRQLADVKHAHVTCTQGGSSAMSSHASCIMIRL